MSARFFWVAVKELELTYHNSGTIGFMTYPEFCNFILENKNSFLAPRLDIFSASEVVSQIGDEHTAGVETSVTLGPQTLRKPTRIDRAP